MREQSVRLTVSLLYAVEVMLPSLVARLLLCSEPRMGSSCIFWNLQIHPSGIGTNDGETEEFKDFESVYL